MGRTAIKNTGGGGGGGLRLVQLLNPQISRKIYSLCTQFSLFQFITQPTHFTENSSSLIDVILVTNKENLILSGVVDPFLNQELSYHSPVYGILKFSFLLFQSKNIKHLQDIYGAINMVTIIF